MKQQNALRLKILEMYFRAGAGHIACSLSCIDILYELFLQKKPNDRIILSKGHAAAALYACLEHFGEINNEQLRSFYKEGTRLCAHPSPYISESATFATGSLGHGLPVGTGIALAKKLKNDEGKVFILMSDGETNEGTTWEAAHFSRFHKLDNLVIIVDKNAIQGFDKSENVLGDTSSVEQWRSLGAEVMVIKGHDNMQIKNALRLMSEKSNGQPKLIIAETVKGKGVSFMENTVDWHYWSMNQKQYYQAVKEIKDSEIKIGDGSE